jgi:hypothetical protein
MLNQKIEQDVATNLVFVFVRLNDLGTPEYYVAPRADVTSFATANHRRWLSTPGRKGQKHRDTTMRKFADPENKYLGRWDLLGLG